MGSNDALIAILGIGALGLGAMFLVPKLLKNGNGNGIIPPAEALEEIFPPGTKIQGEGEPLIPPLSDEDLEDYYRYAPPPLGTARLARPYGREDEDVYLITDEDFDKLDISKRERRWLDEQRRLRDARLARVVYGDNSQDLPKIPYFSGYVNTNTVNPYGQGPAKEFVRLPFAEDESRTNTRSNTLNLY